MRIESPSPSPYLQGNYAPVAEERQHGELRCVEGAIPADLAGVFLRNGANPALAGRGRHHWFDGDGMVHAVEFHAGRASYRNRYVRTAGYDAEREAGAPLWTGLLEPPDLHNPRGPYKNTANTDLVYHHGKLLALWWVCGDAYVLRLPDLASCGADGFEGTYRGGMTAHAKVDPRTGELVFQRYGPRAPYLSCGVLDAAGRLVHLTDVELPGPRLQHDLALTENYTILLDMAMHEDPALLRQGKVRVRFFRDEPTRFGLLPRRGTQVRWFDASPCYIYHTINAWEEGDAVVLVGCKIEDPLVGDPGNRPSARPVPAIAAQLLGARMWRWRFDLRTGTCTEEQLDDEYAEFPRIDGRRLGVRSEVCYSQRFAPAPTLLFDALIRYEHERGAKTTYEYPPGWYASEVAFAAREGSSAADDGYLVSFAAEEATGRSQAWVFDAGRIAGGPVAKLEIPCRVPTGFHTCWVGRDELQRQAEGLAEASS